MKQENKQKENQFSKVFGTTKKIIGEYFDDECLNLSAGIAYFTLQCLLPLVIGFIAIGSFILRDNAGLRYNFQAGLQAAIPSGVGDAINLNDLIEKLSQGAAVAGIISVTLLLWTGSGIFDQFINAVNKAFDVEKDERNFFVKLALRLIFLVGLGGLLILAFGISIIARLIFDAKISVFGISPFSFSFILPIISYLMPIALQIIIFALLFRFGPARKGLKWKPILVGAVVSALLFEALKAGFSLYITVFGGADGATKTYGTLGGIVVFLLFIYFAAAVILVGAEVAATLHNFESGLAAAKTPNSVVEAKDKNLDKPTSSDDDAPADAEVTQPQTNNGNRTLANAQLNRVGQSEDSKLKLVLGAIFLFVITFGSLLLQGKRSTDKSSN
jgi:membrane protein